MINGGGHTKVIITKVSGSAVGPLVAEPMSFRPLSVGHIVEPMGPEAII